MTTQFHTDKKISHYEIKELLGSGGMGVVYRGKDLILSRPVALKFLQPSSDREARKRFVEEARLASATDHPNICTIFDVEETEEGEIFIVMACYDGESLDRIIARGPLDIGRALSIAVQTGRGLSAAHEELITHQDIKPGNLMITPGDTVKILDFGLAVFPGHKSEESSDFVAGTPQYMSPEQLMGVPVDHRTDIWSLGVVLYEMLTGQPPFKGADLPELIQSVINDQPAPPSTVCEGLSSRLDQIIAKALAKKPHDRYSHIDLMIRDLLYIQSAHDTGAITLRLPKLKPKSSIAILPFEDLSPAGDQDHLCDGIAEEILRTLSRIPDLHVASSTSSFQYRNRSVDIRDIGAKLNVNAILEGTVQRAGNRVRISAQLSNVENGFHLWYEQYDLEIKDILTVQNEIAEQIAKALQVKLVNKKNEVSEHPTPTDTEAYEIYLQGRQFFHQHRRKALEVALQTFSRAIEIYPDYARAYAGMADCHSFLNLYFGSGDEAIEAADKASAKALSLAPDLSDAHASRGLVLFLKHQFQESELELRRAIEIDPQLYYPHYIFGRVRFSQGRINEAASHFRHACDIVPEAYDSWYLLGMCYRRMDDAARAQSADLDCIESVKRWVRYHPDDTRAWTMGAAVLAKLGEPERASEWIVRALAIDAEEPIIEYNASCVYASLGKTDEAIKCLQASVGLSGISKDWVDNDPDLDPLRDAPRFKALVKKMKTLKSPQVPEVKLGE